MSLLDEFPHTVDLLRTTITADSMGGDVEATAAYEEGLAAWCQPAGRSEIRQYGQRNQRVTHKIYLREDPGLKLTDKVLVHGGPEDGKTFDIIDFGEATAGLGVAWRVMVELPRE